MNNLHIGVIILDKEENILLCNKTLQDLFHVNNENIFKKMQEFWRKGTEDLI